MLKTILAFTVLNTDGSVQYESTQQPRVERHYYCDTYSNALNPMEKQQRWLDRYNEDSRRMHDQNQDRYFQQELLRSLE